MRDIALNRLLPAELYTPIVFSVAFIAAIGVAPTTAVPTGAAQLFYQAQPALAVDQAPAERTQEAPPNTASSSAAEFDYNSLASQLLQEAVASVTGLFCEDYG